MDGTYELFRQHFGQAAHHRTPVPNAAALGVLTSSLQLISDGATHVGIASDTVIESFRNDLWPGYKTSAGMDPVLLAQIPLMEELLEAAGFTVWAMIEHEADDALGAAAAVAHADERVTKAMILTPDKDLAQCVRDQRIVQVDRRKREEFDRAGVIAKFGVPPESIADYLALVGDSADGYPGLPGWGSKSAAAVLAKFVHITDVPRSSGDWGLPALRGCEKLAVTLRDQLELALLFRRIATVETDVEVGTVDDWAWRGPQAGLDALVTRLGAPMLAERADRLAAKVL